MWHFGRNEQSKWDHIVPRKHGGEDDLTNRQALCFKCNANKGARDNVDLWVIREGINAPHLDCIFCNLSVERVIASNALALAIRDAYPITQVHTVMPKQHAATFFDLFEPERRAINQLIDAIQLATPVLIINGARDPIVPPVNATYLHERLPKSELELIDAGHFIWEDAADSYASLIIDWWTERYKRTKLQNLC